MTEKNEIKTDFLTERISQNEKNQTVDINKWAFEFVTGSEKKINILELCCGTGRQTAYLLQKFPNAGISCLDASIDAINTVKNVFENESGRMKFYSMGIDEFFTTNDEKFDIIFCSYGLYYSHDISFVLAKAFAAFNPGGRLMVMGPYGDNNKQIFEILTKLKVAIAPLVLRSSSTFMYEEVLSHAVMNFATIHVHTTQNNIYWNDAESVLNYWKNSTFFDSAVEEGFTKIVNEQISEKGNFVNEKKIMFLEAVKQFK